MINKPILLVEDNADDEFLSLRTLGKAGFTSVSVARDGVEAIELLFGKDGQTKDGTGEFPSFILLDLKLPRFDGIEVLRSIRVNGGGSIPVLVISSSREPSDYEQCQELGVKVFLNKPLDRTELEDELRSLNILL